MGDTVIAYNETKAKIYIPDKRKIRVKHKSIESKIKEYNIGKSDYLKIPITEVEKFYEDSSNTI